MFFLHTLCSYHHAGLSQCFTNTDCSGALVPAADQRACCVGTDDGLSYNNGTTCTLCKGIDCHTIFMACLMLLFSVHGFLQHEYDLTEGAQLDTVFQLNVKGNTQFGRSLSGTITAEAAGTASIEH